MANPKWFDAKVYSANKLLQLQETDPKSNWTAESLTKAFEEAGYKGEEGLFQHFNDYGAAENVSPNALFDTAYYLTAKAAAMNAAQGGKGKVWTAGLVLDAIKEAGMTVWQHYELYGSNEGIATSADFDTVKYIEAKTQLMNETKEGGRNDWTIAEVKEAFTNAGLSALEHFNEYGKAELEAAGKTTEFKAAPLDDSSFDPNTGAQSYTLVGALAAEKAGALASAYTLTDLAAGAITVDQYNGLDALISGASDVSVAKTDLTYTLEDTVAGITDASTSALAGSTVGGTKGYNIVDTLANVAKGDDNLVNQATTATATIKFAADDKAGTAPVVTTVKYADVSGNDDITLTHADAAKMDGDSFVSWTNTGAAVVSVDGSAETKAMDLNLNTLFKLGDNVDDVTFNAIGGSGNDVIIAHDNGGVITGGKGADVMTAGNGIDTFAFKLGDSGKPTDANFDEIKSFGTTTGTQDKIDFDIALKAGTASDAAAAGKAQLGADGKATFDASDSSVAQMIAAVASALADQDAGSVAWFIESGNTYVFVSDGATGVTDNDVLIKLTGTSASAGTFSADGDLTFSA